LELEDEFNDNVPKPLVGQFKRSRPLSIKNVVKEIAVVVIGFRPLL
jgi:hypothetical protein